MTEPEVFIKIPDHTIGVVPGQAMPLRIHIFGVEPQSAYAIAKFIDPAGRSAGSVRDTFEITTEKHLLELVWAPVFRGAPGTYWVQVLLELHGSGQRIVTSRPFQVVHPGRALPGELCPVERTGPIRSRHEFPEPDVAKLGAIFDKAEACARGTANADGSFGKGYSALVSDRFSDPNCTKPVIRDCGSATAAYVLATLLRDDERIANLAHAGVDYLMRDQHESGAFVFWNTDEGILNDTDNFYVTSYGGLALTLGHEILQHPGALEAALKAADWIVARPFTGNVNYDLFPGWFLPRLTRLTGKSKYLDYLVTRVEEAAFEGQNAGGAWPRHDYALCYHAIILLGMATLYRELPEPHPFKERLRTRLTMAANFMASLIAQDGKSFAGWRYHEEEYFVDWEGRPGGPKVLTTGIASLAWRTVAQCLDVDESILWGLCDGMCRYFEEPLDPKDDRNVRSPMQRFLAITSLMLWLKDREEQRR